jgi:hypothetical protein
VACAVHIGKFLTPTESEDNMTFIRSWTVSLVALVSVVGALAPAARADVVVNGTTQPAPPPPAPAPAPVVVQPQPVAPVVQPVAPVEVPARRTTVVEHETHNYMGTIFVSALAGGLAGLLVGGSLYYLADNQQHASRIGYWAAGGVIVGTGVGITQVIVQESRAERATAMRLPTDPAPTLRLALLTARF